MLSENCSLLGTDDVFGQVSEHIRVLFYHNSALIVFKSNFPSFWNREIANPLLWICSHELSMLLNFTPVLLLHENKGGNTIIFLHVWWKWVQCLNITLHLTWKCDLIFSTDISVPSSEQITYVCRGYRLHYPSNIFLQHEQFRRLENITQLFSSFSWGIFSHVTFLDQSLHLWVKTYDELKAFVQKGRISNFGRFSFFGGSS